MVEHLGVGALWLSGGPGAGKTTIGELFVGELTRHGDAAELLDEDALDAHLGRAQLTTTVARVIWIATVLQRHHVLTGIAIATPDRAARDAAIAAIPGCVEVFVDGGAAARDFEAPIAPAVRVPTLDRAAEASAAFLASWWEDRAAQGGSFSA